MDRLSGPSLRAVLHAACEALNAVRTEVDRLNVFPIPDADTGSNMSATLTAAYRGARTADGSGLSAVAEAAARAALFGAQGNSGLILSQYFAGLAEGLAGLVEADGAAWARALARAAQLCRQAVETPREGTILSVADAAASGAAQAGDTAFGAVTQAALRAAEIALRATPAQMEALVGRKVEDAGGFGLVVILRAFAGTGDAGHERDDHTPRVAARPAGEMTPVRRVAIVTDSGSDLPEALCRAHGIHIVPLSVEIDGERRLDGGDTLLDELYRRMRSGAVPRTAAPSPGAFLQLYESLLARHDAVVSIHISARLSGTLQAAKLAQRQLGQAGGARLGLVDSASASMGCGLVALAAAVLAAGGKGFDEVLQWATEAPARLGLLGVVDSLRYLEASGRIGRARGLLGSLLQAKPLLTIQGGEVFPKGRARGRGQALVACADFVREHGAAEWGAILISDEPGRRDELLAQLPPLAGKEWIVARFGATIGSHIGPGSFGVAVLA